MTAAEQALRSVRDCGTLGVREPARNAALEALATKGLIAVRLTRIGSSWWRVYSLVRP